MHRHHRGRGSALQGNSVAAATVEAGVTAVRGGGMRSERPGRSSKASDSAQQTGRMQLQCSVCLDDMRNETVTVCGHIFCKGCIEKAVKASKKCPMCRKALRPSQVHPIYLQSTMQQ
eukprot:TRINITY_DN4280_c0_g1_i1.p3 TRINITY_DN4280_c0_g1~~TRINITY_DN4280_c0_g1_i1.p3  ORF type:complete len:117 (+),score=2.52 TRINITY_DN4280_c0_g1_i1:1028-1378(+)